MSVVDEVGRDQPHVRQRARHGGGAESPLGDRAGRDVVGQALAGLTREIRPWVVIDVVITAVTAVAWPRHGFLVGTGRFALRDRLAENRGPWIVAASTRTAVLRIIEPGSPEDGQVVRQARMADIAPLRGPPVSPGEGPQIRH